MATQKPDGGIHAKGAVAKLPTATFEFDKSARQNLPDGALRLRITLEQQLGSNHTIAAFKFSTLTQRSTKSVYALRQQLIADEFSEWHAAERKNAVEWKILHPQQATSNLPILTIEPDDSIFASGDTAKRDDYYLEFGPVDFPVSALQLEALPDLRLPAGGPGSTYYEGTLGDFYLTEIEAQAKSTVFPFRTASETYTRNRYGNNPVSAALAIDGDVQTGWSVHDRQGERHVAVFNFEQSVPANTPIKIRMTFGRHFASSLGRFRFSATSGENTPQARTYNSDIAALIRKNISDLTEVEFARLRNVFLLTTPHLAKDAEQIRKLRKRPSGTSAMILTERPAGHERTTHRHHRGEYLQPRDQVTPGLPDVLKTDQTLQAGSRLEFARWLVSGRNTLTARVVAKKPKLAGILRRRNRKNAGRFWPAGRSTITS